MMNKKIRILIANNNQDSIVSIKNLLEPFNEFKITGEALDGEDAINMSLEFQPDIVVLDTNMPVTDGFTAASKISQVAPYIGIILVGSAESTDILRRAMQCGAGDFLEIPLSSTKLRNSIASLYTVKQEQKRYLIKNPLVIPHRQPKVISVFSSKGGVGKTVLATNVAVSLKSQTREEVLLIDLDLQFGDVSDLLNVSPKTSIVDLLADRDNIDITEVGKYFASHYSGIKILAAPCHPEQADMVNENDVKDLIPLFMKSFDYTVIDLPPLFNELVLKSIEMSDHLLLISTMEIPTLKNIKGGIEILKRLDFPMDKVILVLNRFNGNREIKAEDIQKFLGMQDMYNIDDNAALVSTSINTGEPLVLSYKETPIARQIAKLTSRLIEFKPVFDTNEKKSFLQNLFKREI